MSAAQQQIAAFNQRINSATPHEDVAAILHLHREWWNANHGVDIPRMEACFPPGDNYLMFNLQGHPYYGLKEKVALWEFYAGLLNCPEDPVTRVVQLVVDGDVAWLAAEVLYSLEETVEGGIGTTSTGYEPTIARHRIRSTECYLRDNGAGEATWKMWHFHCSPLPVADEPRPAFGDTARSRGELVP